MRALGLSRVKERAPRARPAAALRAVLETAQPQGKLAAMDLRLGRAACDSKAKLGRSAYRTELYLRFASYAALT